MADTTIKPCPACGHWAHALTSPAGAWVECGGGSDDRPCWRGPCRDSEAEAVDAWNALPRLSEAPRVLAKAWAVIDETGKLVGGPIPVPLRDGRELEAPVSVFNWESDAKVWSLAGGATTERVVPVQIVVTGETPEVKP